MPSLRRPMPSKRIEHSETAFPVLVQDRRESTRVDVVQGALDPGVAFLAVGTLDLLGPGLTLFTGPGGPAADPPDTGAPIAVRRLHPIVARAVGAAGRSGLLVRA